MSNLVIVGAGGHTRATVSHGKINGKWNKFEILDLNFNNQSEIHFRC